MEIRSRNRREGTALLYHSFCLSNAARFHVERAIPIPGHRFSVFTAKYGFHANDCERAIIRLSSCFTGISGA